MSLIKKFKDTLLCPELIYGAEGSIGVEQTNLLKNVMMKTIWFDVSPLVTMEFGKESYDEWKKYSCPLDVFPPYDSFGIISNSNNNPIKMDENDTAKQICIGALFVGRKENWKESKQYFFDATEYNKMGDTGPIMMLVETPTFHDCIYINGDKIKECFVRMANMLCMFLSLKNAQNGNPIKIEGSKKQVQFAKKIGSDGSIVYKELLISTTTSCGRKIVNLNNNEGLLREHWCRGHIANYTSERPLFGKYTGSFWIPPHIKGNKEKGQIIKDYVVKP